MAKISKITAQRRKGRYNVYLDGRYAFPVAESVLVRFRLAKGMELDKDQVKKITTADQQAQVYAQMLDYLSYQMRSEHEVLRKLHQLDCPPEFIDPIMEKLRDRHLVDDRQYAQAYVRTAMTTSLKGPGVIRQHLRQKRVGENDIEAALTAFTPADQKENAQRLARKLFKHYRRQPAFRQEQKVRQGLMTKGYSGDLYDQIKDEVKPAADPDQQAALLAEQAAKVWHRYRRYAGFDRERRFKQAMFRKGFDLDSIQQWLNDQQEGLS